MSTDLMSMDAATLARLQQMANDQDQDSSGPKVPIIKINYDPESKFDRGVWLIGQEKDKDGNITEEGRKIVGMVILDTKHRYNLYNQKNKDENCCSPMFDRGEEVRGNKHGYVCGKTCPKRDKEVYQQNACKAQIVVFGMALTEDNEAIFARIFVQGATYMPFTEYLDAARQYSVGGRIYKLPTYAFTTMLSSEKRKNEGTTYFAGVFQRGPIFDMEQIEKFAGQLDKCAEVIGELNAAMKKGKETKTVESSAPSRSEVASGVGASFIDVTPHSREMSMSGMDDVPFEKPSSPRAEVKATPASSGLDFNIEDAISRALGSL
ncbi:MAG: hypothetical protein EOL88_08340 [Bacteroidia bacterium]|nr:hypothetical protein [Bacteroidia bacterium]